MRLFQSHVQLNVAEHVGKLLVTAYQHVLEVLRMTYKGDNAVATTNLELGIAETKT